MKSKPFKAVSPPLLEGRSATDVIRRAELVALIASRVPRGVGDDDAVVRNRVSSMVTSEVKARRLVPTQEGFALGDVCFWASMKWPGLFADLPVHAGIGYGALDLPGFTVIGAGHTLPDTLQNAHQEILTLHKRVDALQRELECERARARSLEPDANKYRNWTRNLGRRPPR